MPPINASEATLLNILTQLVNPGSINTGQESVSSAGTAVAIGGNVPLIIGVTVKALLGNSGPIYVGNSGVNDENGFVLAPGEQHFMAINNINLAFIDADNDGDGVSFSGN